MDRDIIDRLMDFDAAITAADRVNMRECAAIEIHKLRKEVEQLKEALFEANYWNSKSQDESLRQLSTMVAAANQPKSAPERSATQNTAEGLPPAMAQCAGADTHLNLCEQWQHEQARKYGRRGIPLDEISAFLAGCEAMSR